MRNEGRKCWAIQKNAEEGALKEIHIMEAIAECIEKKIFCEWKHEGYIDGTERNRVFFNLDGRRYVVTIEEKSAVDELILDKYGKRGGRHE